jgi:hypothetical protein
MIMHETGSEAPDPLDRTALALRRMHEFINRYMCDSRTAGERLAAAMTNMTAVEAMPSVRWMVDADRVTTDVITVKKRGALHGHGRSLQD